ncbi:hypothetical protein BDD43_6059 [Mucilaginibacter gracilis]|uniref:Uncharacterized protein n=1 Tax=Mucilaginibacter gracilis TaxID=423350 RepID=A0A495JAN4_9SPHI|nr:hypothetical protein BDD43_6059 [Mucilaginibacter gracilis]
MLEINYIHIKSFLILDSWFGFSDFSCKLETFNRVKCKSSFNRTATTERIAGEVRLKQPLP